MFFDNDFEVILANTDESKQLHYALRYQVYCQETEFEDPHQFDNQLETDDFDGSSVHFIARSKKTKEWIGAIRLIASDLDQLPTYNLLPHSSIHRHRMSKELNQSQSGVAIEISRLCILSSYRRGGDRSEYINSQLDERNSYNQSKVGGIERRRQPEIMLGLLRAAYAYCQKKQVDVCLFTATKSLARILSNLELKFTQAGNETNYHGLRVPYYTHIPTFLGNIKSKSPVAHQMFTSNCAYHLYDNSKPEVILPIFAKRRARFLTSETNKMGFWNNIKCLPFHAPQLSVSAEVGS